MHELKFEKQNKRKQTSSVHVFEKCNLFSKTRGTRKTNRENTSDLKFFFFFFFRKTQRTLKTRRTYLVHVFENTKNTKKVFSENSFLFFKFRECLVLVF